MSGWDHVHNLMVEIGDLMDLPQVTEYAEEDVWHLVTEAGSVEVDYDGAGDRVLLTMPIGLPDRAGLAALYEELLLYNGRLPDPWAVRAGLEEPDGEVVLTLERPATGLDAARLRGLLEELINAAGAWRERLQNPSGGTTGDGAGGAFHPDMIRA